MSDDKLIGEREIRAALLLTLTTGPGAIIQEELRIEHGGARIDVATISPALVGYEIKSDKDTFARFANQIHAYNRVFDKIHLVCGPFHARQALAVLPSWWGLWVAARNDNGEILFNVVQAAGNNPNQDSFSLASLLWKDEAIAALAAEGVFFPKRTSSHAMWERIASTFPVEKIRRIATEALVKRNYASKLAVNAI